MIAKAWIVVVLLALSAASAFAQDEAPQPYPETIPVKSAPETEPLPPDEEDEPVKLTEVVVTANKRVESPRKLASSVSVLTGQKMEQLGIRDVDDIVAQVPGMNVWDMQNGTTPKRITVRGISAGELTAATTGVFLDETPFTDATVGQSVLDLYPFDLYSVEVLKGPVGTLFGGSGLNGAIRYIPQAPAFSEWEFKGFGEIGTTREGGLSHSFGGAVNVPLLSDTLALRFVATDRHSSGFMDSVHPLYTKEDINTTDQQAQRAILKWEPLSRLSLSFMYVNQETALDDVLRFTEQCCNSTQRTATPRPSPKYDEYQIYNLKGKWSFDWADLVVNVAQLDKSGFVEVDNSFLVTVNAPPPTLNLPSIYEGTSQVQEIRLVSNDGDGRWDWLIGAFNYRYDLEAFAGLEVRNDTLRPVLGVLAGVVNAIPGLSGIFLDQAGDLQVLDVIGDYRIGEQAVFGEVNFRFTEGLQATAGLRSYRFTYDILNTVTGVGCVLQDPACLTTGFASTVHPTANEQGLNPKLSLKWQATRHLLTYVTLAKGFRFGGVNLLPHPEIPTAFRSDSLWSLEGGVRTEWFGGSLITDLTAYAIRWSDAQVRLFTSDGLIGYVDNVGEVEGRGLEAQLIWLTPLPGLRLTVIPAYADIRTAVPFNSGSQQVPEGTQWPLSPRLQTLTTLSWSGPLIGMAGLSIGLTHRYSSKAPQELVTNRREVFGFSTLNFELGLKSLAGGGWPELALNVNNLTDKRGTIHVHPSQLTANGAGDGTLLSATNEPRSATLRLTFNFH